MASLDRCTVNTHTPHTGSREKKDRKQRNKTNIKILQNEPANQRCKVDIVSGCGVTEEDQLLTRF